MQLEGKRLALLELEIVDVGLCGNLDALLLHELLIGFTDERFQCFLPDRIAELLANHGRRRLAGPEPWQSYRRRVPSGGFIFRILHSLRGHRNLNVPLDSLGCARRELDFHVRNITVWPTARPHSCRTIQARIEPTSRVSRIFVRGTA